MNGSSSEALVLMEWFCGSPKTRRVPQEAVFGTECVFRTVEGCFWYRVPSKEQGKGPPETSSALTGPKKWRKGPERTKRAESSQKQTAAEVIVFFGCLYQESREAAVTRDVKKSSWCALANEMRK